MSRSSAERVSLIFDEFWLEEKLEDDWEDLEESLTEDWDSNVGKNCSSLLKLLYSNYLGAESGSVDYSEFSNTFFNDFLSRIASLLLLN